jgi:DNA-binding NarL/FixJ family response regulator
MRSVGEVLQLIAAGETTKAIARTLGISVKTFETYRSQLMGRLEIHDVAASRGSPSEMGWSSPGRE